MFSQNFLQFGPPTLWSTRGKRALWKMVEIKEHIIHPSSNPTSKVLQRLGDLGPRPSLKNLFRPLGHPSPQLYRGESAEFRFIFSTKFALVSVSFRMKNKVKKIWNTIRCNKNEQMSDPCPLQIWRNCIHLTRRISGSLAAPPLKNSQKDLLHQ